MSYVKDAQPERRGITSKGLARIMVVVAVLGIVTPFAIVAVLKFTETSITDPPYGAENPLGLSIAKDNSGNWVISVISGGGQDLGDVTFMVSNATTGALVMSCKLNAILAADGACNDTDANGRINAGDSLMLTASANGGHCQAGMKVQFFLGESALGTIKALPA